MPGSTRRICETRSDKMRSNLTEFGYAQLLAKNDLALRYSSSALGPFWITAQMFIFVIGLGFVFSGVFNTPISDFLPYLAISITAWNFFSACVTETTMALIDGAPFVKDRGVSLQTFILKVFIRNLYMLAHNIVVPILVFIVFQKFSMIGFLMAVPGFIIFGATTYFVMRPVSLMAARFRDFKPILESVIQLAFLVSPIMWQPEAVAERRYIVDLNPLAALLSIWREPLINGDMPRLSAWVMALLFLVVIYGLYRYSGRFFRSAVYWL